MLPSSAFPICRNPVCSCTVGTNPPAGPWDCELQTSAQVEETVKRQWRTQVSNSVFTAQKKKKNPSTNSGVFMYFLIFCHLCFGLNHIAIALVWRGRALNKCSTYIDKYMCGAPTSELLWALPSQIESASHRHPGVTQKTCSYYNYYAQTCQIYQYGCGNMLHDCCKPTWPTWMMLVGWKILQRQEIVRYFTL